ncbi:hypothetical protein CQA66_06405 [Helicobacter aurati]|uniref:Sialidase n=1 Tax=Helicobacter aurati TaxID=137778 RepID=A0A3D8J2Y8_9HELI|nr:hypothetical protein [Helicobacter aurati]RDU71586.1 hypothetical protein CQA66_06405 [Helicobacter aurati]
MQDFEKLKELDIEEIHRKTRITVSKLHDILDKNFANIHSIRAHGFIKILEREFNLNLQSWIDEYEQYHKYKNTQDNKRLESTVPNYTLNSAQQNSTIESKESKTTAKGISNSQQINIQEIKTTKQNEKAKNYKNTFRKHGIQLNTKKNTKTNKIIAYSLIAALVILLIVVVVIYSVDTASSTQNTQQNNNDTQPQAQETYPHISLEEAILDEKESSSAITDSKDSVNSNALDTENEAKDSRNAKEQQKSKPEQDSQVVVTPSDTLTIIPKKDVWFAWINLTTKQKGEKYTKESFTLQTDGPMIFHFGNMLLTFSINGKKYDFQKGGVTYLLYERESGLKEISQKEFNTLKRKAN